MSDYRDFLIPADSPRLTEARGRDPWTYAKPIRATERAQGLIDLWQKLYREPFRGITTDGTVLEGRYAIADEGFDVRTATAAARPLLGEGLVAAAGVVRSVGVGPPDRRPDRPAGPVLGTTVPPRRRDGTHPHPSRSAGTPR